MSEKLGNVAYGSREDHIFVGRDITRSEDYSEETAREIDLEVKQLIETAKVRSDKILNEHKDQLELLAQELLKEETLTANEVRVLLGFPVEKKKKEADNLSEKEETNTEEIKQTEENKIVAKEPKKRKLESKENAAPSDTGEKTKDNEQ